MADAYSQVEKMGFLKVRKKEEKVRCYGDHSAAICPAVLGHWTFGRNSDLTMVKSDFLFSFIMLDIMILAHFVMTLLSKIAT